MVEIACDESGADGENLVGGNTLFFAHASVDLPVDIAAAHLVEIRARIRSPATEYKANHLLREKHRAVLEWLLGALCGRAHVELVHKESFLVGRVVEVLGGDLSDAEALLREKAGAQPWGVFLRAANRLLRVRADVDSATLVREFLDALDALRQAVSDGESGDALARLAQGRERAHAYRAAIPTLIPVLDPLFPTVVATAAHWSAPGVPVHLVHDRQTLLSPARIAWIRERAGARGVELAGMRLVQARHEPRVQLADFLAGIARKIAGDALTGAGDPVLGELLRPYLEGNALKNAIT
ncbi:hypothetical protein [Streptomyces roseirectus]|uniref:hypothetical protein n=1 Tax=Streptomyces roseirectus TaxID=2768066 RepID=UPI001FE7535F|nr:hypothetical protein [Streptomyces roseirectus]